MIIDVNQMAAEEKEFNEYVGYRKPRTEENRIGGFDIKMMLVGLTVALLFIGGAIYAWPGSQLRNSLGVAVQDASLPKEVVDAEKVAASASLVPAVTRNTTGVVRRQTPSDSVEQNLGQAVQAKQAIQVVFPNGGEAFCSGQSFRIAWRYANVEQVRVFLEAGSRRYDLGMAAAQGGAFPDLVQVPPAEGAVYRVVVQAYGQEGVQDISDAPFAIQDCPPETDGLQ